MKKAINYQYGLALTLNLVISQLSFSQVYTFSKDAATYHDLISPVNLNGTTYWDDENWVIPIGFKFLGHDTLTISSNGLVSLANYNKLVDQQITYTISAFADASIGADLIDRDINNPQISPINYQLSGTSPDKILKIEWRNAGFIYDNNNVDHISFQLWLYEDSNKIEMRYGQHYFLNTQIFSLNNSTGAVIGIGSYKYGLNPPGAHNNQYVNSAPSIYLIGSAKSPGTSISFSSLTATDTSDCAPANGTRFTFKTDYSVTGIYKAQELAVKLFPNPVSSVLHIEFENKSAAEIFLFDTMGQLVFNEIVSQAGQFSTTLNIERFSRGLYMLKIESENFASCKLLSVQ
ncbi:MAG TPA: T9SS type A sorting domain-containing protein [Cytophagaceae bacterium]|nr:T9SS type A sorting domain-containing protein [Cytophagaceae bacterium]